MCDKTCIFCFFPIINKYLRMAKRSLLSRCPSYILTTVRFMIICAVKCMLYLRSSVYFSPDLNIFLVRYRFCTEYVHKFRENRIRSLDRDANGFLSVLPTSFLIYVKFVTTDLHINVTENL